MKKYEAPKIAINEFDVEDILTTSADPEEPTIPGWGGGESGL